MVSIKQLLNELPPFADLEETIEDNQDVDDIMQEVIDAHIYFSADYDRIYHYFDYGTITDICRSLFDFCKLHVPYKVETEANQTTRSPAAILTLGSGDCKHYASFIGGVLGAINRNSKRKIVWFFRFASYDLLSDIPGHVFIVAVDRGSEIWVDPVLQRFNYHLQPQSFFDEKINEKGMLKRISGIGPAATTTNGGDEIAKILSIPGVSEVLTETDLAPDVPYELQSAITVLMNHAVMNEIGDVDTDRIGYLIKTLPNNESSMLIAAVNTIQAYVNTFPKTISGWLGDAFKFVQHYAAGMGMQVPRAAFLGLVAINGFGYATKLQRALQFQDTKDKLSDLWERVGGKFSTLENTIISGAKKKAVLKGNTIGIEPATGAAAIIGSAAIIIAAIMPVITRLLDKHNANANTGISYDANGMPVGYSGPGGGALSFITQNPVIVVGAILILSYFITQTTKQKRA